MKSEERPSPNLSPKGARCSYADEVFLCGRDMIVLPSTSGERLRVGFVHLALLGEGLGEGLLTLR